MMFYALLIWILPLFAAQPMLAPIYNPVTHMVPPPFPVWLVVPAVAIDLLVGWERRRGETTAQSGIPWHRDWLLALALGVAFLGLVLPAQWIFSAFMLSPTSDNWLFAGHRHWPYTSNVGTWSNEFWRLDRDPVTWRGLAFALALACGACRTGLWFGNWMLKVRR